VIITHVLRCLGPRMTGHVHSVPGLGRALAARGHTVWYWGGADPDDRRQMGPTDSSMRVFEIRRPYGWFYNPDLVTALRLHVRSMDIVHVHGLWSHPNWAAVRTAARAEVPCILAPRGELSPWALRTGPLKRIKKAAYLATLGRSIFHNVGALHALNAAEADACRRAGYRGPVTIIPNGIDGDAFSGLPEPGMAEQIFPALRDRRVVLFMGRISPEKGLDAFLPAMADVVRRPGHDDTLFVVAGHTDNAAYHVRIQSLVDRLALGRHVLFTGHVDGDRKSALLSRADVFALPSRSEGFSMAVLEALAAAKPVLITPACSFPDVVQVGAGLCCSVESTDLADGLIHLLELSADQRARMGRTGRRLVCERYTWDRQAARMLAVYRALLDGRHIPEYPEPEPPALSDGNPRGDAFGATVDEIERSVSASTPKPCHES